MLTLGLIFHSMRGIYHNIQDKFRILRIHAADKGQQIIGLITTCFFCGSGFPPDLITVDFGIFTGTDIYYIEQSLFQVLCCAFTDCLSYHDSVIFPNQGTITVFDLTHYMRFIIGTAIYHGTVRCDLLNHGHIAVLTKGIGSQSRYIHIFFRIEDTCLFSRQINACLSSKAKENLITGHNRSSHSGADIHKGIITGIHQSFRQGLVSMGMGTSDIPAAYPFSSVTGKHVTG